MTTKLHCTAASVTICEAGIGGMTPIPYCRIQRAAVCCGHHSLCKRKREGSRNIPFVNSEGRGLLTRSILRLLQHETVEDYDSVLVWGNRRRRRTRRCSTAEWWLCSSACANVSEACGHAAAERSARCAARALQLLCARAQERTQAGESWYHGFVAQAAIIVPCQDSHFMRAG